MKEFIKSERSIFQISGNYFSSSEHVRMSECVCVCKRERERESGESERERENVCVCAFVCVCECVYVFYRKLAGRLNRRLYDVDLLSKVAERDNKYKL